MEENEQKAFHFAPPKTKTSKRKVPINSQILIDAIKKIVDEINLMRDELEQMEAFSAHTFRYTFATRCFEAGIQPKTVQKYLGHATLQITMDLHTHVWKEQSKEDMDKLGDELQKLSERNNDLIDEKFEAAVGNELNQVKIIKFSGV